MDNEEGTSDFLGRAQQGDEGALGELLLQYQPMLEAMARDQMARAVQPRVSELDVVQQSCLSAVRDFQQFEGDDTNQFVCWLKQIHRILWT